MGPNSELLLAYLVIYSAAVSEAAVSGTPSAKTPDSGYAETAAKVGDHIVLNKLKDLTEDVRLLHNRTDSLSQCLAARPDRLSVKELLETLGEETRVLKKSRTSSQTRCRGADQLTPQEVLSLHEENARLIVGASFTTGCTDQHLTSEQIVQRIHCPAKHPPLSSQLPKENRLRSQGLPKIAFFVGLRDSKRVGHVKKNTDLLFDTVFTNVGGAFSPDTGRFTAPLSGTYYFTAVVAALTGAQAAADFVVNGKMVIKIWAKSIPNWSSATSSLLLNLKTGDQVWLVLLSEASDIEGYLYSTFSGHCLFTEDMD